MKLESFRAVGVEKIVSERGSGSIVSNIPRFFTKLVHEFYANLSENIIVQGRINLKKMFVSKHVYEFSPRSLVSF